MAPCGQSVQADIAVIFSVLPPEWIVGIQKESLRSSQKENPAIIAFFFQQTDRLWRNQEDSARNEYLER